jgi:AcrR family transcriptional regulator
VPTGVHLGDARGLLFEAAERVVKRDGVSGLTSRAVTTEAGVAKGVFHRHVPDVDASLPGCSSIALASSRSGPTGYEISPATTKSLPT